MASSVVVAVAAEEFSKLDCEDTATVVLSVVETFLVVVAIVVIASLVITGSVTFEMVELEASDESPISNVIFGASPSVVAEKEITNSAQQIARAREQKTTLLKDAAIFQHGAVLNNWENVIPQEFALNVGRKNRAASTAYVILHSSEPTKIPKLKP